MTLGGHLIGPMKKIVLPSPEERAEASRKSLWWRWSCWLGPGLTQGIRGRGEGGAGRGWEGQKERSTGMGVGVREGPGVWCRTYQHLAAWQPSGLCLLILHTRERSFPDFPWGSDGKAGWKFKNRWSTDAVLMTTTFVNNTTRRWVLSPNGLGHVGWGAFKHSRRGVSS